jgi:hypothetical protein
MNEHEETRTGRPCKLTPEVQAKICQAIRAPPGHSHALTLSSGRARGAELAERLG